MGIQQIDELKKSVKEKKITLIEDAAQSIGSYNEKGQNSGSIADISCFSFFQEKIRRLR